MGQELLVEDVAQLHPLLVIVLPPDAPGDLDEVFENRDLSLQLRDRLRGRGKIDDLVCLLLELGSLLVGRLLVEVLEIIDRERGQRVAPEVERRLACRPFVDVRGDGGAEAGIVGDALHIAQFRVEALLASFQGPQDRFGTGGKTALQHGEREPDIVAALLVPGLSDPLGPSHLGADVVGDLFVKVSLSRAQLVLDRVGLAFGEQRLALEGEQVFLHHSAHQTVGVGAVHALPVLALEPVAIQQRHEQLEVLFLARVRRRGHQQEVVRGLRQQASEFEALGLIDFARPRGVVGRHTVGLVNDRDIPGDLTELLGQVFAAGELVHAGDQERVLCEDVAPLGVIDHLAAEDLEPQIELLAEFLPPLLHEPAGSDDNRSLAVRAQDQLLQIEPSHDRLARAGVVG